MTSPLWLAVALAGAVSLLVPFVLRPMLRRIGSFDVPNERSSHSTPTLRGGGIAPLAGWTVGMAVAIAASASPESSILTTLASGAFMVAVLGLLEDLRGLRVRVRLGVQLLLGLIVGFVLCVQIGANVWWACLAAVSIAGYVNVANFMDGVNGISSGHGLIGGAALGAIGALSGVEWLMVVGFIAAATFVAFAPWNLSGPGMFLGDVGSYLLGATLAISAVAAALGGIPLVTVIAPFTVYLADTGWTLVARIHRGEKWHQAHRAHIYQRLVDAGLSHLQVAVAVTVWSGVCAVIGLAVIDVAWSAQLLAAAAILILLVMYLFSPQLVQRLKKVEA